MIEQPRRVEVDRDSSRRAADGHQQFEIEAPASARRFAKIVCEDERRLRAFPAPRR